jgi:hypothetical protein
MRQAGTAAAVAAVLLGHHLEQLKLSTARKRS